MKKGNQESNRDFIDGYLAAEAISVEGLVTWVYHRQRAHCAGPAGAEWAVLSSPGYSADGVYAAGRLGLLGTSIDRPTFASRMVAASGVHADAEAVHGLISNRRDLGAALLVLHGKALSRPDWLPDARPRIVPVLTGRGSPKVAYDRSRKPSYCPLEYLDPVEYVEAARLEWLTWWTALADLAEELRAGRHLRRFRILEDLPPAEPWQAIGQGIDGLPLPAATVHQIR